MQIIDGRKIKNEILEEVKKEVAKLPFQPIFCDVLVGEDPASQQYVKMKAKTAESVGIKFHGAYFPASISTEDLIKEIKVLNKMPNMCGIIVQLPLPKNLDRRKILDAISPHLDVDCLGTELSQKFYQGDFTLGFPTALACMAILDSLNLNLAGKNITVVGQGELVGKPVVKLLQARNLFVNIIELETQNKEEIYKKSDIIISGVGYGKLITGNLLKEGVVLIDAGTSTSKGGIIGDVDLESVKGVASFVSPVPGGVGPVTVAMLLSNVLQVAKSRPHP